uniref:Uncharacterized protein n=1 Tax=Anopheles merus TaxID=30066 RepID=A0A182UM58_ANOME
MEPRMYKTLPAHYQPCHISDLSSGKMLLVAFIRHREIRQLAATIRVPPPPRHEAQGQLVKLFRNRKISHCPTLEMKVKAPAKRIFRRRVSKQSLDSYPKPK